MSARIHPPVTLEPAAQTLGDAAYATLKARIIEGRLAAGMAVSEGELALSLGLGKAPVRAALARLAQDGLVAAVARRGWRVAPVTLADVLDVFRLRRSLEPLAARLAAERGIDSGQLERLDAACRADYLPGDPASERAFLKANRAFHLAVAEASGSRRLVRVLSNLLDESERALVLGLAVRNRSHEIQHEHQALIQALSSGDADAAEKVAAEQIDDARDMVLAALMSTPSLLGAEIAAGPATGRLRA
ncbi:MAG: GntR family transcriptional regulator [Alphaproteobacteria bacterium]|nr:GntR family transcriptional regulator [Alphaproteobacteria bacterium]